MDKIKILKNNFLNITLILASANYYLLHNFASNTFSSRAFEDAGWCSVWTVVFILLGQVTAIMLAIKSKTIKEFIDFSLLIWVYQVYACREADLHRISGKWHNVTNLKFYTLDDAPIMLKCITATILIAFGIAAIYLLYKYAFKIAKDFFKWEPYAVSFTLWGAYLLGAQFLDKIRFFNNSTTPIIKNIEEMGELTASIFALLAISQLAVKKYKELNNTSDNKSEN